MKVSQTASPSRQIYMKTKEEGWEAHSDLQGSVTIGNLKKSIFRPTGCLFLGVVYFVWLLSGDKLSVWQLLLCGILFSQWHG